MASVVKGKEPKNGRRLERCHSVARHSKSNKFLRSIAWKGGRVWYRLKLYTKDDWCSTYIPQWCSRSRSQRRAYVVCTPGEWQTRERGKSRQQENKNGAEKLGIRLGVFFLSHRTSSFRCALEIARSLYPRIPFLLYRSGHCRPSAGYVCVRMSRTDETEL